MVNHNSDTSNSDDPFADRRRKIEELYSTSPIVDVLGVFINGGGGRNESDGQTTLTFEFDAWKIPYGDLKKKELAIHFTSSQEECDVLRELLVPYNIYRVKARVFYASEEFNWNGARLIEFIGIDTSDSELNKCLADLQKSVTYTDPQLGIFTLNRDHNIFTTKTQWQNQNVELTLNVSDLDELDAALQTAHQLWDQQADWKQRVRDYLVQELLPFKNESWRDDGEAEIDAQQFNSNIDLETILVNDDGSFEFWFDDGEMFGYHMLYCRGDLTKGIFEASLG
ncbi:DUF2262 domain-containing protein [uncultured Gimesia sp.]|uniref:DUF2262 domain-containing protein n=1 Tax=uncultured Gimesia sp. TaxID=1678688 RepID=UPI0030D6D3D3|tara:strand:+ start:332959 stop:333804 length:846 start_codon:yes stop_codon:yes gene_type:complete